MEDYSMFSWKNYSHNEGFYYENTCEGYQKLETCSGSNQMVQSLFFGSEWIWFSLLFWEWLNSPVTFLGVTRLLTASSWWMTELFDHWIIWWLNHTVTNLLRDQMIQSLILQMAESFGYICSTRLNNLVTWKRVTNLFSVVVANIDNSLINNHR